MLLQEGAELVKRTYVGLVWCAHGGNEAYARMATQVIDFRNALKTDPFWSTYACPGAYRYFFLTPLRHAWSVHLKNDPWSETFANNGSWSNNWSYSLIPLQCTRQILWVVVSTVVTIHVKKEWNTVPIYGMRSGTMEADFVITSSLRGVKSLMTV